jgi:hypothetical protein
MQHEALLPDEITACEATHVAYADETNHNTGRDRGVAMVTLSLSGCSMKTWRRIPFHGNESGTGHLVDRILAVVRLADPSLALSTTRMDNPPVSAPTPTAHRPSQGLPTVPTRDAALSITGGTSIGWG